QRRFAGGHWRVLGGCRWFAAQAMLSRSGLRDGRTRTNTSATLLVSPGTRLVALEVKATKRPSPLIPTPELPAFPWFPALSTLTRSVVPACAAAAVCNTPRIPTRKPSIAIIRKHTTHHPSP